jgi:hypothetical protein
MVGALHGLCLACLQLERFPALGQVFPLQIVITRCMLGWAAATSSGHSGSLPGDCSWDHLPTTHTCYAHLDALLVLRHPQHFAHTATQHM